MRFIALGINSKLTEVNVKKIILVISLAMVTAAAWAGPNEVCAAHYGRPEIDPVREKIAMSPPASFAQLTDTSKPSELEQIAIVEYDKARTACSNAVARDMADLPDFVDFFSRAVAEEQQARADLYLGKSTFGEYNAASQRVMRAMEAKADELGRRDAQAAQLQQNQGAAIARGAAAGARQALPVYNPFPKPLICSSTRRGTLVDTYCR